MRHITNQIQDLLEGLESLRMEQKAILIRNQMNDVNNLQNLPPNDLGRYQRLQRERKAKGEFLFKLTGMKDDLKILLGQISRLTYARDQLLKDYGVKSPLDLPFRGILDFTTLWDKSDIVVGMMDRVLREGNC